MFHTQSIIHCVVLVACAYGSSAHAATSAKPVVKAPGAQTSAPKAVAVAAGTGLQIDSTCKNLVLFDQESGVGQKLCLKGEGWADLAKFSRRCARRVEGTCTWAKAVRSFRISSPQGQQAACFHYYVADPNGGFPIDHSKCWGGEFSASTNLASEVTKATNVMMYSIEKPAPVPE